MWRPYYPPTTPACFHYSSIAHHHGSISSDEYLDRMLAHLSGLRHVEDTQPVKEAQDSLSMIIQSCMEELDGAVIEDTSSIRKLFVDCWIGTVGEVKARAPIVLSSLKVYGISTNIYEALLCIVCRTTNTDLFDYLLSLDEYLSRLKGTYLKALQRSLDDIVPSVTMWKILLREGLCMPRGTSFSPKQMESSPTGTSGMKIREDLMKTWSSSALSNSLPTIELLEFLMDNGFGVTETYLASAASKMSPDVIRWLLTKCDYKSMTGRPLLCSAYSDSPQVVDMLLDAGFPIEYCTSPEGCQDPFAMTPGSETTLHCAAEAGKLDIVRLLLERGARKEARNSWGQTAEVLAAQSNRGQHLEVVQLLKSFVPSGERYIVPSEDEYWQMMTEVKAQGWKFTPSQPAKSVSGPLIDFSENL